MNTLITILTIFGIFWSTVAFIAFLLLLGVVFRAIGMDAARQKGK